jgi:hypothetical protein
MPGTATYYSRHRQTEWVAFFNLRPADQAFSPEVYAALWRAVRAVGAWPNVDYF